MSELQHKLRQLGDAIVEIEGRQAVRLGEVKEGVRQTTIEIRRRLESQMLQIDTAVSMINQAHGEIKAILDDADRMSLSIGAEIENIRAEKISPTGLVSITGGKASG